MAAEADIHSGCGQPLSESLDSKKSGVKYLVTKDICRACKFLHDTLRKEGVLKEDDPDRYTLYRVMSIDEYVNSTQSN